jgi:L-ascorbate metabolism protein UlaG (beta-lactamase superfamily)
MATRQPGTWRKWTDSPPGAPPPERVSGGHLRATFIGHSTVLLQTDGINVLCDPIWSMRASPLSWIGPRRHRPPGLRFEDLPSIDVVFQSHDHYDHMDFPTLRRVAAKWRPRLVVPLGVRARLVSKNIVGGVEAAELDWWDSTSISSLLKVTAVPARHFSGRGLGDRNKTLWCGYVVEGPSGSVYFAGDTGYGAHFHEIRKRFPKMRLAFLPVGAFQPQWFMGQVHMSPDEAVRAHRDLGAGTSVGIHFGTFRLADDGENEPVEELQSALAVVEEPRPRFYVLGLGEGREVP